MTASSNTGVFTGFSLPAPPPPPPWKSPSSFQALGYTILQILFFNFLLPPLEWGEEIDSVCKINPREFSLLMRAGASGLLPLSVYFHTPPLLPLPWCPAVPPSSSPSLRPLLTTVFSPRVVAHRRAVLLDYITTRAKRW